MKKPGLAAQKKNVGWLLGKYGVYIAFAMLFIILSILTDGFLTPSNLSNIFKQISVIGVMAVGMTLVIATGGIDLSVGAVSACAACVACNLSIEGSAAPLPMALLIGCLVGVAFGMFSGICIAWFNVPAFIATLATSTIARGIVYVYTNGYPINGVTDAYKVIGRGTILEMIPVIVVIYIVVILIGAVALHCTGFGRHVFALGGNERAAIVSGININRVKFSVYIISGLCAAIGGILLSSRVQTGAPASGTGYETDAITAVVIGGASLSGGRGTIVGSVIGMLLIGTLSNGLDLLDVSSYYQQIVKGVIILLAVIADSRKNKGV